MPQYQELRARLEEILSKRQAEKQRGQREIEDRMAGIERREKLFQELAPRLFKNLIEPKLKMLEEYFQDARYQPSEDGQGGKVIFNRDRRFDASATLNMGLALDTAADTASITYQLHIIPILFTFQAEDSFAFPLEGVHEGRIRAFVEKKILESVENYLKLTEERGYQKDSMVADPVCGMTINRLDAAASFVYEGNTYYFCVPACRDRFLENPQRFIRG